MDFKNYVEAVPSGLFPGRVISLWLVIGIILFFLLSALLMWLWNITITRIFNIREITFWEAFRLMLIAGILFGGLNLNF